MALSSGTRLGPYEILSPLGAGGMGEVYRARDSRLDRDVAIKVLPEHMAQDPAALKRFEREAKAVAALSHPNILEIHEFDTEQGVSFVVTELLEGDTLRVRIARSSLPWKESLEIAVAIAEGLSAAHSKGIIHRDLKPENIFLTSDARVKILDFGLARLKPVLPQEELTQAPTKSVETKAGILKGTVPYMSPEQLRGVPVDARSDIFSFGCVLYEMLGGKRAFFGDTAADTISAILGKDPPELSDSGKNIPPEVNQLTMHCLEKKPEQRFQSASDLGYAIRSILSGSSVSGYLSAPKRLRFSPAFWIAGIVIAIVALVAVLVMLNVGGLREQPPGGAAPPRIESLAVLPLKNLMGDPEQDYFVEGMHEALTTELSRISALKVISRTSAMRYRDTEKAMPQIARELGVEGLIEGSVMREGDQVRITVQLIHGPSDRHLWAQSFDRELRGILALHSEVARLIADNVRVKLTPQEQTLLASARPVDPEAYDAVLRGFTHLNKWTPEGIDTALDYFQLALEKNPNYAPAYVGICGVWFYRTWLGYLPPGEGWPKAKEWAEKALELDDTSDQVHRFLALLRWVDWDWTAAEREFRRAIELNPNYADVRAQYCLALNLMGRPQEARIQIERALELDPYNPTVQFALGNQLKYEHRYDKAIAQYRKVIRMQPEFPWAHENLWEVFHIKGSYEEALAVAKQSFAAKGDQEIVQALERGYAQGGYRGAMRQAAETLEARSPRTDVSPWTAATLYVAGGENDRALDWLEKGYQEREAGIEFIKLSRRFDPLRDHPRFQKLLQRMNLPQ